MNRTQDGSNVKEFRGFRLNSAWRVRESSESGSVEVGLFETCAIENYSSHIWMKVGCSEDHDGLKVTRRRRPITVIVIVVKLCLQWLLLSTVLNVKKN